MRTIIRIILASAFFFHGTACLLADEQEDYGLNKYIVTAYYSPLPDQQFYLRGNYEDEVRLNGEGRIGASGKGVYPGMIAAPKTYAFGTKIFLDGVGIGTVDDRGGAIVGSGSRGYDGDRLDIWMGYGEDGLRRALSWGKRVVYGRVLGNIADDMLPAIALNDFDLGNIDIGSLQNASFVGKNVLPKSSGASIANISIVPERIGKESKKEVLKYAQTIFRNLGYYTGSIDGIYSRAIVDAIADFQRDQSIVDASNRQSLGCYGPKTKKKLEEQYLAYLSQQKIVQERKMKELQEERKLDGTISELVKSFGNPMVSEVGKHVRKLQRVLKLFGYFDAKDTAIFGKQTKEALLRYQLNRGLVSSPSDAGAGEVSAKTRDRMQQDLKSLIKKKEVSGESIDQLRNI